MFISGHQHYLRLKVLRRYFPYILLGQPVCCALVGDGGGNHESAYYGWQSCRLVISGTSLQSLKNELSLLVFGRPGKDSRCFSTLF